jgi:hypothetical protein
MNFYVKYWVNILELLSKPISRYSSLLLESFWPFNNLRNNYQCTSIHTIVDVDLKDHVIPPYYGPKSMRPSLNVVAYTHFSDLFASNFVLVRHSNLIVYHAWMGRVKTDVVRDQENENYRKVYVQWWVFMKKGTKNDE